MLLAVTNDLMATAPIEHAARQLGAACRVVTPAQIESLELAEPPRLAILDLTATSDVAEVVTAIRVVAGDEVPVVAFGPHVHEAKLRAATAEGCSQVLTRGQFHRDVAKVVGEYLADR